MPDDQDDDLQPKKAKLAIELGAAAPTNANTTNCAYWVKRKKRFCKMTVSKGKEYCGEHEPAITCEEAEDANRVPCPLDGKHTVYKKNLQKHLKICNARQKDDTPLYIEHDINAGDAEGTDEDLSKIKLNELSDEEFFGAIAKVKELYEKFVEGNVETMKVQLQHPALEAELAKLEYGKESKRHLMQTSALLSVLESEDQLQDSTSFVEFGAGKGQLAFYLAQLLQQKQRQHSQVLLIDRMSLRHKKDNRIEDRSLVQRIRADIADFRMYEVPLIQQSSRIVAISKHLCGAATDLTLRCISQRGKSDDSNATTTTEFILIALCCHHRCDWRSFVGKEFCRAHSITPRQFSIITKMVSWAICGTGMSRERRRALEEQSLSPQEIRDINSAQRLTLAEREQIGFKCKRVLDYARLDYLRQLGYSCALKCYVSNDVTLENVCLVAKKNKETKLA